jgi:hypothetical protein
MGLCQYRHGEPTISAFILVRILEQVVRFLQFLCIETVEMTCESEKCGVWAGNLCLVLALWRWNCVMGSIEFAMLRTKQRAKYHSFSSINTHRCELQTGRGGRGYRGNFRFDFYETDGTPNWHMSKMAHGRSPSFTHCRNYSETSFVNRVSYGKGKHGIPDM